MLQGTRNRPRGVTNCSSTASLATEIRTKSQQCHSAAPPPPFYPPREEIHSFKEGWEKGSENIDMVHRYWAGKPSRPSAELPFAYKVPEQGAQVLWLCPSASSNSKYL